MKIRASRISTSISEALVTPPSQSPTLTVSFAGRLLSSLLDFLSFFRLPLTRFQPELFLLLRRDVWRFDETEYLAAFVAPILDKASSPDTSSPGTTPTSGPGSRSPMRPRELVSVGDLGYSGSTFFATPDGRFLVKSLPRQFEHRFFVDDLFKPYVAHMRQCPDSLLVRITDLAHAPCVTLGGMLGLAPTHHIIMENLMYGKKDAEDGSKKDDKGTLGGDADREKSKSTAKTQSWETYDLKPDSYFFPERDLAGGKLAPESVKEKLADTFPSKVRVTYLLKEQLMHILATDTGLLAANNAVDYSLFLVRYPASGNEATEAADATSTSKITQSPPLLNFVAHPWRRGVTDVDGRWTYRLVVLDFFWARHKLRPRFMTALVAAFDKIAGTGPMSITAHPDEYRARFMRMVDKMVVVVEKGADTAQASNIEN